MEPGCQIRRQARVGWAGPGEEHVTLMETSPLLDEHPTKATRSGALLPCPQCHAADLGQRAKSPSVWRTEGCNIEGVRILGCGDDKIRFAIQPPRSGSVQRLPPGDLRRWLPT